jgi:hypothetical protein
LTGWSKRNLNQRTKAVLPAGGPRERALQLRVLAAEGGDIALYRGSGDGLVPILLVAAEETSLGCVERLEHEYALKAKLDADWAARPIALTHYNGGMRWCLRIPAVCRPIDCLAGHWTYRISCASQFLSRGRSAECMSVA